MINITREQFLNFIKTSKDTDDKLSSSTQHYLDYFDRYQQTGKKGNWNWGALVPLWFFYRRMYENGFGLAMISLFLDKITDRIVKYFSLDGWGNVLDIGVPLLWTVLLMRYADYLYLRHASKKIFKGCKKSGTSKIALSISVILLALSFALILFIETFKT